MLQTDNDLYDAMRRLKLMFNLHVCTQVGNNIINMVDLDLPELGAGRTAIRSCIDELMQHVGSSAGLDKVILTVVDGLHDTLDAINLCIQISEEDPTKAESNLKRALTL